MFPRSLAALLFLAAFGSNVHAQAIRWHSDLATARRQASEQQKPLVYDFGTANCHWCKRLDETTFRDAAVQRTIAERFVMVKVDAQQHLSMVQSLGISSYPTLLFASPDGKFLGKHEGYVDADRFRQQLDRAWRDSGLTQTVAKQSKAPTFRLSMPEPEPTQQFAVSDDSMATQLLYLAKEELRVGQYLCCLERCRRIAASYPMTSAAPEAKRLADDIKADPTKAETLRRSLAESLGEIHVTSAEQALRSARWTEARDHLESAIRLAPGTTAATTAETYLSRWRNGEEILRK